MNSDIIPSNKYNFLTENMDISISEDKIKYANNLLLRKDSIITINKFLNNLEKSINIECSIFESSIIYCYNKNFNIEFVKPIYIDKLNNILLNINNFSYLNNTTLLDDINSNKIDCSVIAFLLPHQIHPKKWADIIKKNENNINKEYDKN